MRARLLGLALASLALSFQLQFQALAPGVASAQANLAPRTDKALAEALFDRGLELMRQGDYERACVQLEQSQSIERGIGTMLYLAECYEKQGKTASAWAMFREAASAARAENQLDRARVGASRAERLEPTLSKLTIQVSEALPGLIVKRSGQVLPSAAFGVALPADPGLQRVEAEAPGRTPWSVVENLPPNGASLSVTVPALAPAADVSVASAASAPAPASVAATAAPDLARAAPAAVVSPEHGGSRWQRPLGFVLGGAGVIALGVGTYFGARAISQNSDLESACPSTSTPCAGVNRRLQERAESSANVSTGLFIGGAVLLGAGVIVLLSAPSERALALGVRGDMAGAQLQLTGSL